MSRVVLRWARRTYTPPEWWTATTDFVLVLEDLQSWENADHLAGLSMERARIAVAELAALHGWSMNPANSLPAGVFPGLDTPAVRDVFFPVFGLAWPIYLEHAGQPVPASVARYAERFTEYAPQALEALSRRSMLLHGDIRADNMFFSGDTMKVVDFQFASVGAGASDIAYLVSQGLPAEVRAGHDEALVREYVSELVGRGVTDYSFDEAWRDYRLATAYLMVLPVITLDGLGLDAGTLEEVVPQAHRAGGGDHRRDRRAGGLRMSTAVRTAREVVELYNLELWNNRKFDAGR